MSSVNCAEKYEWTQTRTRNVWLNLDTEKYHYSYEADLIDEVAYDSVEEASLALILHCEYLNTMNVVTKHF